MASSSIIAQETPVSMSYYSLCGVVSLYTANIKCVYSSDNVATHIANVTTVYSECYDNTSSYLTHIRIISQYCSLSPSFPFQIMAIIVILLGVAVSIPFHIFVHEKPSTNSTTLKWYKWLVKPEFYLVCVIIMNY